MEKSSPTKWRIVVKGVVQSVGFRPFIKNLGDRLNLKGYVRNLGNEGVEIVITSSSDDADLFINNIHQDKPELSEIHHIDKEKVDNDFEFSDYFEIKKSENSKKESSGIIALPPDIAICRECTYDQINSKRRHNYAFTSCTNCGPRYTAIEELPYDRPNTSFREFPLCKECIDEYSNPKDRRFHAQTTCCINCGPDYSLYINKKNWEKTDFNWDFVIDQLMNGKIFAIMGTGGTHYVLDAFNKEAVTLLRKRRRKSSNKPFAVMISDIPTIRKYCEVSLSDIQLLKSKKRPIMILPTLDTSSWDAISPSLNNLGVMLPYSGYHNILFRRGAPDVLVMTSANLPNLPMPITPKQVLTQTKNIADFALVHNRKIVQRIDDSVIRSHGETHLIIRRSRGYVPSPLYMDRLKNKPSMLAVGAEENNTGALFKDGWFIPTQHIGHVTNAETLEFQQQSLQHLIDLYRLKPDYVISDLHPQFLTRQNAEFFSENNNASHLGVQHHVAHAASLALDAGISPDEPFLAWVCDGYGYGQDGHAWGSELILLKDDSWERLSSLYELPYSGSDMNAKYPARMTVYYLQAINEDPIQYFEGNYQRYFKHGKKELEFLTNQQTSAKLKTSSMGRLLDAISVLLGFVSNRTYRGEPAIVFEQKALMGKEISTAEAAIIELNGIKYIDSKKIFRQAFEYLEHGENKFDIAYQIHQIIGKTLAEIAISNAESLGLQQIGFSGGVAYNYLISNKLMNELDNYNLEFVQHSKIPPGDAGISSGQLYFTARNLNE